MKKRKPKPVCKTSIDGSKHWCILDGECLHREDGPAIEYADGTKEWYINGVLHREGRPAVERINGDKLWYIKGKLHREDGPAMEFADGSKAWYLNGNLHREDGPANEYANGTKEWYLNDKRHREDGPAIVYADGSEYWYIDGEQLTEAEFDKIMKKTKTNEVKQADTIESLESQIDTLKKKLKVLRDIKKKESLLPQQEKIGRGAEIITEALATSKFNKSCTSTFACSPFFLQVRLAGNYAGQGLFLSEKSFDIKWQIVVDNGGCQVLIPAK